MIKIKKIVLLIINLIFLMGIVNFVNAENVGIVVELGDGTIKTDCVKVNGNTDGRDILEKTVFDILWSPKSAFGSLVCKIEGEGTEVQGDFCEYSGEFWNFNILPDGNSKWIHSPVGHDGPGGCWNRQEASFSGHYCSVDKDVLGYKFGSGADEPPLRTYKQVCENLQVKGIKTYVDGKKESGADEDGGKIDVVPGSKLELKTELENIYTDDDDVDIEGIIVQGTLKDIDDGSDLEDEAKEFDLSAEKDKEITLKFDIPLEVEEDDYDLVIEIEGGNERGFSYFNTINFKVDVEKERHDVIFDKLDFLEDAVQCGQSANLQVKVMNLGTEDESTKLVISNQELGINTRESFELGEDPFDGDNSFFRNYRIALPSAINSGLYAIKADLFYAEKVESKNVELNIECGKNALKLEGKNEEIKKTSAIENVQKITEPVKTSIAGAAVLNPDENNKKLSNGDILMISIVSGEVILLVGGIALLVYLLRR